MKQLQFIEKNTFKLAKQELDSLFKNQIAILLIRSIIILLGFSWIISGFFYQYLPIQIPMLFSKPWGESQLVPKYYLFLLPGVSTVFFLINLRLSSLTISKDQLLCYIFLWIQVVNTILSSVAVVKIIFMLS